MPKQPPDFTGHSHEDMKRLLQAEEDRRDSIQSLKVMSHIGFLLVLIGIFVIGLIAFVASLLR